MSEEMPEVQDEMTEVMESVEEQEVIEQPQEELQEEKAPEINKESAEYIAGQKAMQEKMQDIMNIQIGLILYGLVQHYCYSMDYTRTDTSTFEVRKCFLNTKFDFVFSSFTAQHMISEEDFKGYYQTIHKCLKARGIFILVEYLNKLEEFDTNKKFRGFKEHEVFWDKYNLKEIKR